MDRNSHEYVRAAAAQALAPDSFDYLIVGAGFAGSVLAERLANVLCKRVLIVDKRAHIGDEFHDQLDVNGFTQEISHLDRLAGLGITRLRLPLLSERTEKQCGQFDWRWAEESLARLAALKVKPIAGLLHQGSGPAWTHLLDPSSVTLLADYASKVAARYPHIRDWTPVNEPLTTARFSGLYGLWYPHCNDYVSFVRALLNQVRARVLAMKAVHRVTPHARLIQT